MVTLPNNCSYSIPCFKILDSLTSSKDAMLSIVRGLHLRYYDSSAVFKAVE